MTDAEILNIARGALPDRLKAKGLQIIRRGDAPTHWMESLEKQDSPLNKQLEDILKFKLPAVPTGQPRTAEVAVTEETELGTRTTVVQIRDGVPRHVITQA